MQQFNLGSPVSACATSSLSGLLLEARIAPDSQKLVTAFQRIEFKPVADVAYRVIAALECPLRGHSEKSALKLGMSAIPLGADIRDILRRDGRSGTRLKDRMVKVQTTLVASP
jgi:hypothetical protein